MFCNYKISKKKEHIAIPQKDLLEKNLNSKVKKNDYETIRNCIENGEKNNINMDNKNKKYSLKIK